MGTKLIDIDLGAVVELTYTDDVVKNKYENNANTNAYTDAEKTQVSVTETTTQLNARDTANRDRSNHTGTQLANTVSDLTTRIKTDETTTSIALNVNSLDYIDEDGTKTSLDLTKYLDDTTVTVSSGVLDGTTGIATFTRSDSTTFEVDLSALLDDTQVTVVDVLTSTSSTEALSAGQGKVLKTNVDSRELASNKITVFGSTASDTKYPSEKLVKGNLDIITNKLNGSTVEEI